MLITFAWQLIKLVPSKKTKTELTYLLPKWYGCYYNISNSSGDDEVQQLHDKTKEL